MRSFFPHEWEDLYKKCGFTEDESRIIELKRRNPHYWTNANIAAELDLSERTINRRKKEIERKILHFTKA